MKPFCKTEKQKQAIALIGGNASNIMLFGGSRSGKTFILVWVVVLRALAAARSRHTILRFRFNHIKASIVLDTFPKVMSLCFPDIDYHIDKTDWYAKMPNGSEIWFGGLDDKERTEKILGQEHATIYLNECSQIGYNAVLFAMTRLAQVVMCKTSTGERHLSLLMLYDCNPPSEAHWSYKLFKKHLDPETKKPLTDANDYACLQINPADNKGNLDKKYLERLENMPARIKRRFWDGEFADVTENALWTNELIDRFRVLEAPQMVRVVISVDPSGAGDTDNADNDAIGIVVAGLGEDGIGYILEDVTVKAGPKTWGNVAVSAYDRHEADIVVGETNYGGEMVKFVVQAAKPGVPFHKVNATRGKHVRADPISVLYSQGKVKHVGTFPELEDEMCGFTTAGYIGDDSPNRVDAMVWAITELFPRIAKKEVPKQPPRRMNYNAESTGWMA